jgi:hypothetical protein
MTSKGSKSMNIEEIVKKVIPPSDYKHRNGFNNRWVIDNLTEDERKLLEDGLLKKLDELSEDTLIIDSLAYLKSEKAISYITRLLKASEKPDLRIFLSAALFEINGDRSLIDPTIKDLGLIENKNDPYYVYSLISIFQYLIKFKDPIVNYHILQYTTHKEYLVSYNANRVLENADFYYE